MTLGAGEGTPVDTAITGFWFGLSKRTIVLAEAPIGEVTQHV